MEKEFKELLQSSKKIIGDIEKKVEGTRENLSTDMGTLWGDIQTSFTKIKDELLDEGNKEKAQEKVLEAKEKLDHVKDSVTKFATNFKNDHQADLDITALRAHLAKMDAEDFLEEKRKKISREVQESSHSLEKMAFNASKDIQDFFASLSEQFNKKS